MSEVKGFLQAAQQQQADQYKTERNKARKEAEKRKQEFRERKAELRDEWRGERDSFREKKTLLELRLAEANQAVVEMQVDLTKREQALDRHKIILDVSVSTLQLLNSTRSIGWIKTLFLIDMVAFIRTSEAFD